MLLYHIIAFVPGSLTSYKFPTAVRGTQLGNTSHRKQQVEQLTPKLREYIAARFSEVLRLDLIFVSLHLNTFAYICIHFIAFHIISFHVISYHLIPR